MATKLNQLLFSGLFLASLILISSPSRTLAASDECPYPCYPPPTGPGGTISGTPPPPAATGSSSNSNSNSPAGYYSPPSGYLPYTAPPPPYGGNYGTLSPPDPILPYFPYYYRKPPHKDVDDQSSAAPSRVFVNLICLVSLLVSVYIS